MTTVEILRGSEVKRGDTLPALRVKLMESGHSFNLTEYDVTMKMSKSDSNDLIVDAVANVTQDGRGIVEYEWADGDTDDPGTYVLEFVADDGSGSTITFPNNTYKKLYINRRLGE